MIAANFRKYPQAMALQWPLPFGRVQVWALPRPTTRILRKIRALRGAAFKAIGKIVYPVKPSMPAWVRIANKKARELAKAVKAACIRLDFTAPIVVKTDPKKTINPYNRKYKNRMHSVEAWIKTTN